MRSEEIHEKLMNYVNQSPCSFFAVANLKRELREAGFRELKETEAWRLVPGDRCYVSRNSSSLISFILPEGPLNSFHVIAAHSDSPSFKLKPGPLLRSECGLLRASVEKYGGPIDSTWFDRPLSVSGRVFVKDGDQITERLVFPEDLTLMLPSVAPHLLRKEQGSEQVTAAGHMFPVVGSGKDEALLRDRIAAELRISPDRILSADLYLCCREQALLWGAEREFLSAPRLDDLACAYASFLGFRQADTAEHFADIHCVFDNEEIGSRTRQGADSGFLRDVLERICEGLGLSASEYHRAVAAGFLVSADNAHAAHPNYEELSDPVNRPQLNGGLVLKHQAGQRYATDAETAAVFRLICQRSRLPVQDFTNRPGSPGGSTLGNLSISHIPLRTADIGLPQLAMHSCFETIGARDVPQLTAFAASFYGADLPAVV